MTAPEVLDELERWANDHADSVTLAISCGKIRSLIADARDLATLKARIAKLQLKLDAYSAPDAVRRWGRQSAHMRVALVEAMAIMGGCDDAK